MKVSVVIPVYKSVSAVRHVVDQLHGLKLMSLEVVLVNDSPQFKPTCEVLKEVASKYPKTVKVVKLRKNNGQQLALLAGIAHSTGDYIVTLDDDGQHAADEIPKLIEEMHANSELDAIFAIPPYTKKKHALVRNIGSYIFNKIDNLIIDKSKDLVKSSFRVFKRSLVPYMLSHYSAYPTVSALILECTCNVKNTTVAHMDRQEGKTNYGFWQLLRIMIKHVTYQSAIPLTLIGVVGCAVFVFSLLFILFTVTKKIIWGIGIPGYTTQVSLIAFFGSANLIGVGVIGEYLYRIIAELRKPSLDLIIDEVLG